MTLSQNDLSFVLFSSLFEEIRLVVGVSSTIIVTGAIMSSNGGDKVFGGMGIGSDGIYFFITGGSRRYTGYLYGSNVLSLIYVFIRFCR